MSHETAIGNIRRALQHMSETLAVAAPHVEDVASAEVAARLSGAYARLMAASAEIDALREIAQEIRRAKRAA